MTDDSTRAVLASLSSPAPQDARALSRRRFLQASAATSALTVIQSSVLPGWLLDEAAAAVAGSSPADGVLVVVTMAGGNDAINTVIPISDPAYLSKRGGLAIPAASTLRLDADRGLHPALPTVKSHWDAGNVAIIEGVGHPTPDLSHFTSMARVMHGSSSSGIPTSGWLGRAGDRLGAATNPFVSITFGSSVPLLMQGQSSQAIAVPERPDGLFEPETDPVYQRQYLALARMSGATGLGVLGDELAFRGAQAFDIAGALSSSYQAATPEGRVAQPLTLAARLINANMGVRVLHLLYGDFDHHADQAAEHALRLAEFDAGLAAFFATLDPVHHARTMVLTTSEFGRRIEANASRGTDHGAASTWLAIGQGVNGGRYGALSRLSDPDRSGNLRTAVDYRSVYDTVLTQWLKVDAGLVLGGDYGDLGFLEAPTTPPPPSSLDVTSERARISRLYLAYFLRLADYSGLQFWMSQRSNGRTLVGISDAFAASPEFTNRYGALDNRSFVLLVYQNVLGRAPDAPGLAFWTQKLNEGTPRGQVMIGFSESEEFVRDTTVRLREADTRSPIARLYRAYYLREPDVAGLKYWLDSGQPLDRVSAAFAAAPEFAQRYGSMNDEQFTRLVYQNVMDRAPDAAGLTYWLNRLAGGMTRGQLMLEFSESEEFRRRLGQ